MDLYFASSLCLGLTLLVLVAASDPGRDCTINEDCLTNESCGPVPNGIDPLRTICSCQEGFDFDLSHGACVNWAKRQCLASNDCRANEECTPLNVCACGLGFVPDTSFGCRPQACEDTCLKYGFGDTCRNGQCLRCWIDGTFVCTEYLPPITEQPPTILVQTRPSFIAIWMWSFLFLITSMVFIACVWKCCAFAAAGPSSRRSQHQTNTNNHNETTTVHQSTFNSSATTQSDATTIKMPLQHNELPPPYSSSMVQLQVQSDGSVRQMQA